MFLLYFCHILAWLHNNYYYRMFVCRATSTLSVRIELSYVCTLFLRDLTACPFSSGPALPYTPPTTPGGDIMTFWCFSQATCSCRLMTSWGKRHGSYLWYGVYSVVLGLPLCARLHRYLVSHFVIFLPQSFFFLFFRLFLVLGSFGCELETIFNDPYINWHPYIECRV